MKKTLKLLVLMLLVGGLLVPLTHKNVAEAVGIIVGRVDSCPSTCCVGDTIEFNYTVYGIRDSLISIFRIWATAEEGDLDQSILLHSETITEAGKGTISFTVDSEAGQFLMTDFLFYDENYEGDLATHRGKSVVITDGEPLKAFMDMNLGRSGWVNKNGKKYYGDENGIAVTGKREIDGETYYFNGIGMLMTGWFKGNNHRWHYSDEQGIYRAQNMAGVESLTFPSYVDNFSIEDLYGISKDFYIKCEPGSAIEKFAFKYCIQYDNGQKKVISSDIDNAYEKVKWIVANYITPDMSEREKINKLFVWLNVNSCYDDTRTIHSAEGVLIQGTGVCQSSALAFCMLLDEVGIENKYITGEPNHAWTLVRCNGQWYHTNPVDNSPSVPGIVFESADSIESCPLYSDEEFKTRPWLRYSWDPEIQADENKVGWVTKKDGTEYYYDGRKENGGRASGLCTIDETDYLFDDDGKLLGVANEELFKTQKINSFVARCYQLILGREPDAGGLQGWSDALLEKTSAAANIIDSFVRSDEFKNRTLSAGESVDILYRTMLDRPADEGGKSGWVDALNKGYTLQHIINGFCTSAEFAVICSNYEIEPGTVDVGPVTPQADESTPRGKIEAFVKRCYSLILSRDADQGGLQGWSDALEQRTAAAAQIIDGFVRSPEYAGRNLSAGESVDILYQTMLGRAADEGGKAGWVDALGQGYTLQHIINGFCGSAEFTAICDNYGIVAGSVAVSGTMVKREAISPEGDEAEAPVVYQGHNSEFINEEKIRAFVEHCYVAVFGREGDTEGVENYTKLILNEKKMPKKVAYEFIFSSEFQEKLPGNEEFIRILYRLYFDREPGAEELAGWVQMLENGVTLEEIVNGFSASLEFKAIVNGMKQ